MAAKHWLQNLDNQYRLLSGRVGLAFFKPNMKLQMWQDWRKQPFCAAGLDFGSDGVSGLHAAGYHFGLNIDGFQINRMLPTDLHIRALVQLASKVCNRQEL